MNHKHKTHDLYRRIWEVVSRIPAGNVATYGQIARVAGLGEHARVVGYAMHNLPPNSKVPWHRVINSKGKISLPKDDGQYDLQKVLLEQEGIIFCNEKVNLKKYCWQPDDSDPIVSY